MNNSKINFQEVTRYIKEHYSVTDYANNVLGMNCTEGQRCAATYRNGINKTTFISYGDSYTDWGHPEGRIHSDVIQLCADARHNGSRSDAIKELAASFPELDTVNAVVRDKTKWADRVKSLEFMINKSHEALRPQDIEYLHSRRISDATINRLKIGYSELMQRILIPYFRNGHVVYYAGRDATNGWKTNKTAKYTKMKIKHAYDENIPWGLHTLEPKHRELFPPTIFTKDGTKEIQLNSLLCVLEGMFDAISFEQEGFQVLSPIGGFFNQQQHNYFLSIARSIGKVFICFDNDGAGTKFQNKMANLLLANSIPFVSAVVPAYAPYTRYGDFIGKCDSQLHVTASGSKFTELSPGDMLKFNRNNVCARIESIQDDTHLILAQDENMKAEPFAFDFIYVSRKCKDISDYYAAGGDIAELVANAQPGVDMLVAQIGDNTEAYKTFIKGLRGKMPRSEISRISGMCKGIDKEYRDKLVKETTEYTQNDVVNELVGYTDELHKYHEGLHKIIYIDGVGFYEYTTGAWRYLHDKRLEQYIKAALGGDTGIYTDGFARGVKNNLATTTFRDDVKMNDAEIVNFQNGIMDLTLPDNKIWKLKPHDEKYYSTNQVPYVFDRLAVAYKFQRFIEDVTGGDKLKQMQLQEYFGYGLYKGYPFHKMLFMLGEGRNGKSTLIEIMRRVLGEGATSSVDFNDMPKEFIRMELYGSIMNFSTDNNADLRAAEPYLKKISSGEPIMACRKFQPHVTFTTRAKLVSASNDLMKIADMSRAFLSRCLIVYFNENYEGRENPYLIDELSEELPGIFNWVLEGYLRLRRNGKFTETEEQPIAMRELEHNISPVYAFYDEVASTYKGFISTQAVFEAYCQWCEQNNYIKKNRGSFTRAFKKILKQRRPELLQKYGIAMVKHLDRDYYDFGEVTEAANGDITVENTAAPVDNNVAVLQEDKTTSNNEESKMHEKSSETRQSASSVLPVTRTEPQANTTDATPDIMSEKERHYTQRLTQQIEEECIKPGDPRRNEYLTNPKYYIYLHQYYCALLYTLQTINDPQTREKLETRGVLKDYYFWRHQLGKYGGISYAVRAMLEKYDEHIKEWKAEQEKKSR